MEFPNPAMSHVEGVRLLFERPLPLLWPISYVLVAYSWPFLVLQPDPPERQHPPPQCSPYLAHAECAATAAVPDF